MNTIHKKNKYDLVLVYSIDNKNLIYRFFSLSLAFLSACSAGWNHANQNDGGYVWVGCHVVHTNPQDCYPAPTKCAYAFGPEGDKVVGQRIYWKQVDKFP